MGICGMVHSNETLHFSKFDVLTGTGIIHLRSRHTTRKFYQHYTKPKSANTHQLSGMSPVTTLSISIHCPHPVVDCKYLCELRTPHSTCQNISLTIMSQALGYLSLFFASTLLAIRVYGISLIAISILNWPAFYYAQLELQFGVERSALSLSSCSDSSLCVICTHSIYSVYCFFTTIPKVITPILGAHGLHLDFPKWNMLC